MTDTPDNHQKPTGRRTLYLLFGIAVLPMLAAYTMFFTGWGVPKQTNNRGLLLSDALSLEPLVASEDWQRIGREKKWRLLIPVPASCEDACQKNMYTTRQVHIRLSEKSTRLERIAVSVGGQLSEDYLAAIAASHPKLKTVAAGQQRWQDWIEPVTSELETLGEHAYFLVDQEGYAIMAYGSEHHGNALLSDIKHALKFSIDYE